MLFRCNLFPFQILQPWSFSSSYFIRPLLPPLFMGFPALLSFFSFSLSHSPSLTLPLSLPPPLSPSLSPSLSPPPPSSYPQNLWRGDEGDSSGTWASWAKMVPFASMAKMKYKLATSMATVGKKDSPKPKPRMLLPRAAAAQYTSLQGHRDVVTCLQLTQYDSPAVDPGKRHSVRHAYQSHAREFSGQLSNNDLLLVPLKLI